MTIWTADFWKSAAERVVATFVMALLGFLAADGFDWLSADWDQILAAAGFAAGLSLLKCLAANLTTKTGPSLTNSEQVVPPEPQPKGVNGI
jgi:hypothetical protein